MNLFTLSEFPDFLNAKYKSICASCGSNGTKVTLGGAIFLTQSGANAIPSPRATNCKIVDLSMSSHTIFGWVPICRKLFHKTSCKIGRACLGYPTIGCSAMSSVESDVDVESGLVFASTTTMGWRCKSSLVINSSSKGFRKKATSVR